eukprot:534708_1
MGVGDATPDGTGVATAGGSGVPADATLLLVSVVHVGNALAGVEAGVLLVEDVVNAEQTLLVVLAVETATEVGEDGLHVQTGGATGTLDGALLGRELGNALGTAGSGLVEGERVTLGATSSLLDGDHFSNNKVQKL